MKPVLQVTLNCIHDLQSMAVVDGPGGSAEFCALTAAARRSAANAEERPLKFRGKSLPSARRSYPLV
jgi:hypothetical protein